MSTLDPHHWLLLSSQLDVALEMSGPEREAWLASLDARDPALAAHLRPLLEAHAALQAVDFLEHSPAPPLAPPASAPPGSVPSGAPQSGSAPSGSAPSGSAPSGSSSSGLLSSGAVLSGHADAASVMPRPATLAGQTFGAYTLTSRIGEGGMGTVWLARRSDGRFEGLAAVKLLNASLVSRGGDARFRREGTILARLAHASIAHLIDAGVSPGGQPYLVLEYVQGEPIDRYCDDRALGVEARIRLFLEVLAAVAYAHANLIVHRDIKPANVLVRTDPDLEPGAQRVKLLDFGIAKLLEPDPADAAALVLTRHSGWALTPAFAAPEQLTGHPVTTATDVYSLGVLLYLLLSGQHPAGAGLRSPAELIAAVVDTDAPRLSDAVTDTKTHDDAALATNAASRNTTPDHLRRALQGDLETIVAKALKKSAGERYPSVAALADDLRRVLEQRPISVRPDTVRYRATKFVRRHRIPVTLAALAVVALGAGLVGTVTQALRATRQAALVETQRQRADQEARVARAQRDFALGQVSRAEAISDLNTFLLYESASRPAPLTSLDLLAYAERIVQRQQQTDENHVEMLISIGRQYLGLSQRDRGRRLLTRAYELSRTLTDRGTRARAACALAPALAREGEGDRAEQLIQEASSALPDEPQYALHRIFCSLEGSTVAAYRGQGEASFERARTAQAVLKASGLTSPLLELQIVNALAESYSHAGRYGEALAAYADASRRLTTLGRDETSSASLVAYNWGFLLRLLGRPLEAEPLLRRAFELTSLNAGGDVSLESGADHLARAESDLHRWSDAAQHAARAYAVARREGNDMVANSMLLLQASISRQRGDLGRAARLLAEVEPRLTRVPPARNATSRAELAFQKALLARARGETTAALALADRAVAGAEAAGGRGSLSRFLVGRSQIALEIDRVEQARRDGARALAIEQQVARPGQVSCGLGRAHLALGRALHAQGQVADARTALSAAVDQLTPTLGADHPETRLATQLAAGGAATR